MKRKRELEIMLSALSLCGIEPTEKVRNAASHGLKRIRAEKYAECCERKAKYLRNKATFAAAVAKKKEN